MHLILRLPPEARERNSQLSGSVVQILAYGAVILCRKVEFSLIGVPSIANEPFMFKIVQNVANKLLGRAQCSKQALRSFRM
jgi:hypothetical protein